MQSIWTQTQVRFAIIGLFMEMPDVTHGISVEASVQYIMGNSPTVSRSIVCEEFDRTEEEVQILMIKGGWDA